jgi:hypothetical protein
MEARTQCRLHWKKLKKNSRCITEKSKCYVWITLSERDLKARESVGEKKGFKVT